ncbi:reverse transcriptase family protein [Herbaspirillum frisingense]|uniref:reverse transcriptase family protein n=1 Tax=Herbaspirillum frisingense TaxID=92645 RepID=UPI001F236518|nr:reverse transcriptase family protein [Herbaspirillum frisingense]UIN21978.1 reverse transcriptase family protein [Herbaspirillum frisingense]
MTKGPAYRYAPILSIQALCRALGCNEPFLRSLAERASGMYIGPKPMQKKSGGIRFVYDTKHPLKDVLKKVNRVFFKKTHYPTYLTGSLDGRDYSTNAGIHAGATGAITEDISQFFPSITADMVYEIWTKLFRFGHEPAMLLTALTTKDGVVFQGTPTGSYIANLVFWSTEHIVVEKLQSLNIRYSRYVDDVTLSKASTLSLDEKTWAISQIYSMIGAQGFKPKREKHGILSGKGAIKIMGLNANAKVSLPRKERSLIRAKVHALEKRFESGEIDFSFRTELNKVSGVVGKMSRFHKHEASQLRGRINVIRRSIELIPIITIGSQYPRTVLPQDVQN